MEIPSEVSEMNRRQFIFFIGLVLRYLNGQISIEQFKTGLIAKLLNIRMDLSYLRMNSEEREEVFAEIFRLSDLCDSFFEEIDVDGEKKRSFRLDFVKQFIPKICGKYFGPQDALQDLTFGEYRMAHSAYLEYASAKDEKALNRMIAILYRPSKRMLWIRRMLPSYDGQRRVAFTSKSNPLILEARANHIGRLPIALRYGIFLWFSGCEKFLTRGPIEVDGKIIDLSIIYEKNEDQGDSPDIGLLGILYSLAETKVFGSIEETDSQNLYDIMIRLYQVVKQAKSLEEKYKSHGID
jgi:hypothetical protein